MRTNLRDFAVIIFLILVISSLSWAGNDLMPITYLTFEDVDTSKSVTINYHSKGFHKKAQVFYDTKSCQNKLCRYSMKAVGRVDHLQGVDKSYHHVKLENLQANTVYYFIVGDDNIGYSKEYKFRTFPDDDRPILVVNGGDTGTDKDIPLISQNAMSEEPQAILLGGDLAYANGKIGNEKKWDKWFDVMKNVWLTPNGFLVPLIVAIGNHEVTTGMALPGAKSPFYDVLFAQDKKTYFARKLGANTILFVLDSGHRAIHGGAQTLWLENQFNKFKSTPKKIAMYHIPLYPSFRDYDGVASDQGRKHWLPLFDKHELTVALEHHDHALKRTKILKGGKEASKGTLYIGDGCFGRETRKPDPNRNYLQKAQNEMHVWSLYIESSQIDFRATGENQILFDHFELINSKTQTRVKELL